MEPRLTLVAILTVRTAELAAFRTFERQAAAVMADHGGRIERTVVIPGDDRGDLVKEIHVLTFPDAAALAAYRADARLEALAALRARAVLHTEVWTGEVGPDYHTPASSAAPITSASIREGYDAWAAVYDHDANPLPALEDPVVRRAVGDPRGHAVLDLGCGTGRHAVWLAAAGARVTAVDFSPGMLAGARRKPGAAAVRFVVHDLHDPLPFRDGAFDLVLSGLVLEHLRAPDAFFAEVRRVLRPGGRAVVSAAHPAMLLRGSQARFTDPASGRLVQPGSFRHTMGDLVMATVRAGLALDAVEEHAPDAGFAARYPRAATYVGWPMLLVLRLHPTGRGRRRPARAR